MPPSKHPFDSRSAAPGGRPACQTGDSDSQRRDQRMEAGGFLRCSLTARGPDREAGRRRPSGPPQQNNASGRPLDGGSRFPVLEAECPGSSSVSAEGASAASSRGERGWGLRGPVHKGADPVCGGLHPRDLDLPKARPLQASSAGFSISVYEFGG